MIYSDSGHWTVVAQSLLHMDVQPSPDGAIRWAWDAEVNEDGSQLRVKVSGWMGTKPLGLKLKIMLGRDRLLDGGDSRDE